MTAEPARFSQRPPSLPLSEVGRDSLLSCAVGPWLPGGCG